MISSRHHVPPGSGGAARQASEDDDLEDDDLEDDDLEDDDREDDDLEEMNPMRLGLLVFVAILCGALGGFGATLWEFRRVRERFDVLADVDGKGSPQASASASASAAMREPLAEIVGEREVDFGSIDRNTTRRHSFVVRNAGGAVLRLSLANVSCGQCVQPEFVSAEVPPGKTANIDVSFITRKPGPEFREGLEIRTNDPHQQVLSFSARGVVIQPLRAEPAELTLGSVSAMEGGQGEFKVLSFRGEGLEVVAHRFSEPETAEYFDVQYEPASAEAVQKVPFAVSGVLVKVGVKRGMPLGPIHQTIHLVTRSDSEAELEVPVRGTVVSDVSVLGGSNFKQATNTLFLGSFKGSEGRKVALHVLVKGPYRKDVQLSLGKIDPEGVISAELGEPKIVKEGEVYMYPLTVQIHPGSKSVNRLGFEQTEPGRIVIETTHPDARQLVLFVRFATTDG